MTKAKANKKQERLIQIVELRSNGTPIQVMRDNDSTHFLVPGSEEWFDAGAPDEVLTYLLDHLGFEQDSV